VVVMEIARGRHRNGRQSRSNAPVSPPQQAGKVVGKSKNEIRRGATPATNAPPAEGWLFVKLWLGWWDAAGGRKGLRERATVTRVGSRVESVNES